MYLPGRPITKIGAQPIRIHEQEAHVEHVISSLLGRYESGTLTRRELIQGLAMLTVASRAVSAADTGFAAASINHVSIQVSDLKRSADFYMRAFALPKRVAGSPAAVRLGVGPSHL